MIYYLNLHNDPFQKIKSKNKTVEMRLFDERRKNITVGDILIFENNDSKEKLSVEVIDTKVFKNFEELYKSYDKKELGYDLNEIANPSDMLKYYNQENIDKYGTLAISIKLLEEKYAIVFDMDDTMLKTDKTISEYSLNVLKKLQDLGHKIVINTARSKYYNGEYFNLIKPDFAILNGGALIIDKNENTVFKSIIDARKMNLIIKEFLKFTSTFSVQTENDFLNNNEEYKGQNAKYFDFENNILQDEVYKIVASFSDLNRAFKLAEQFNLECIPYFDGKFVRFNNKNISKLSGNIELSKILNIPLDKFVVFGDDTGDLEMIKNSGDGLLMQNSHIKEKYSYIKTTSYTNDEDGVAKYLVEKFKIAAKP